jgi:tetratricopeptide (TPR) repeat protein
MAKQKTIEQKMEWLPLLHTKWATWIVFAFSALLYVNTIPNGYNMDDELVTINHRLTSKGWSAIPDILTEPYYKDKLGYSYEYRPVVLISFAIEHELFGESAQVGHFFNVLLYALLCVLLLKVLSLLLSTYSPLIPFLITILFAAHPIHTEVVASIKNRDELLAVMFGLMAWWSAIKMVNSKRWSWLVGVFVAYFVSLYAKQSTSVLLLFIPLSIVFFRTAKIGSVALIYGAMAIALFPALNLAKMSDRLMVILTPIIVLLLAGGVKNGFFSVAGINKIVDTMRPLSTSTTQRDNNLWQIENSVYKQPIFYAVYGLLSIALLSLGTYGIFIKSTVLLYASIVALGLFFIVVRNEAKPIVFLFLATLAGFAAYYCEISPQFVFVNLTLVAFLMAFSVEGILRYLFLAFTAVLTLILMIVLGNYAILLILFSFYVFRLKVNPAVRYLGAVLIAISFIYFLYQGIVVGKWGEGYFTQFLPFFALMQLIQFRKIATKWMPHVSILFLAVALIVSYAKVEFTHDSEQIKSTLIKANWETKVGFAPNQMNRPLAFIETPVTHLSPPSQRIGTAAEILVKYAQLVVLPYPMAFYYGYREIDATEWTSPKAVLGIVLYLIFGVLICYWLWRKEYLLGFGLLFYAVTIFSYTNLFISVPGMMGDRFLFIPSIGFSMFAIGLLMRFFSANYSAGSNIDVSHLAKPFSYILLSFLVMYSGMTIARNRDWKDQLTLFSHDIKIVSESAQAQNLLGIHLLISSMNEQDNARKMSFVDQAVVHFQKALEIYPQFLNAAYDMGRAYTSVGKADLAYAAYEQAMRIDTNFVAPCLDMAIYQQNLGNFPLAVKWYERFLTKYPTQKEAYANLSFAYYKAGDFAASIAVNQRALYYLEDDFEPLVNIGKVYYKLNEADSARYYLQRALQLRPADANIKNILNTLPK